MERSRARSVVALVLCTMMVPAVADFVVETGVLEVELPLSGRGRFGMSLANFGKPLYGGTLRHVIRVHHIFPRLFHYFFAWYFARECSANC